MVNEVNASKRKQPMHITGNETWTPEEIHSCLSDDTSLPTDTEGIHGALMILCNHVAAQDQIIADLENRINDLQRTLKAHLLVMDELDTEVELLKSPHDHTPDDVEQLIGQHVHVTTNMSAPLTFDDMNRINEVMIESGHPRGVPSIMGDTCQFRYEGFGITLKSDTWRGPTKPVPAITFSHFVADREKSDNVEVIKAALTDAVLRYKKEAAQLHANIREAYKPELAEALIEQGCNPEKDPPPFTHDDRVAIADMLLYGPDDKLCTHRNHGCMSEFRFSGANCYVLPDHRIVTYSPEGYVQSCDKADALRKAIDELFETGQRVSEKPYLTRSQMYSIADRVHRSGHPHATMHYSTSGVCRFVYEGFELNVLPDGSVARTVHTNDPDEGFFVELALVQIMFTVKNEREVPCGIDRSIGQRAHVPTNARCTITLRVNDFSYVFIYNNEHSHLLHGEWEASMDCNNTWHDNEGRESYNPLDLMWKHILFDKHRRS
jgi:hypothetical protein